MKTVDEKIISFDVKLIDKPDTGKVPVGGEFEIKYRYVINEPKNELEVVHVAAALRAGGAITHATHLFAD